MAISVSIFMTIYKKKLYNWCVIVTWCVFLINCAINAKQVHMKHLIQCTIWALQENISLSQLQRTSYCLPIAFWCGKAASQKLLGTSCVISHLTIYIIYDCCTS